MQEDQEELVQSIVRAFDKSPKIGALAGALANVQKSLKPAVKNATNPFYKSTYADLGSILDSCRDLLAANKLALLQMPSGDLNAITLTTMLVHESGEFISSTISCAARDHVNTKTGEVKPATVQDLGSTLSYLRRYGAAAMVGIVTEDDDGNQASKGNAAASNHSKPAVQKQQSKPTASAQVTTVEVAAAGCWFGKRAGESWKSMDRSSWVWYLGNKFSGKPKNQAEQPLYDAAANTLRALLAHDKDLKENDLSEPFPEQNDANYNKDLGF